MTLLRLLTAFTKRYWPWLVAVFVLQLVSTLAALYLPSLNAEIIDDGVSQGDTDLIWSIGARMLLVCLVQVVTAVGGIWFGARTAMAVGRDLRAGVFDTVTSMSAQQVGDFGAATLITRGTNDVQQVQMLLLMTLNFMVSTPIMCIGGIVMAVREDVGLSWLVWVSVPLLLIVVGFLVAKLMPLFRGMQDRIDDINGVLREQIIGIRVVRAFVREPHETQRFAGANARLTDVSLRVGAIFVLMFPAIMMLLHLATAAVLWFGGQRVDAGEMQVGSLTAFLQYLLQILMAVMMGTFMAMMIPRAVVCAERIDGVLSTEPDQSEPEHEREVPRTGIVEFAAAGFRYPGAEQPVLADLTFTARPGETVAIIGSTGSGKTTLLSLIPRLMEATSGEVRVDGVSVGELSRRQLAERVSLVTQRPFLFSGTVASNLRFGREDATDAELWHALEVAQAADFVREHPDGLERRISQGGTNVSGGQRQRLCIARTLVARPDVYLFDDSFSALDVTTDARLRRALEPELADATAIIVAQRVATIRDADRILVLDDGRIVGQGTHDELLETNETYQQIVESQLSAEEVA
ncbi:ABC transporter ATP-binding protein [Pseudoclavibacter sp. 13-3]|uniref:ABC transporter ATP-binding protein n=1 Tax=Pseudoclavibacter sp. 13-3 TaxID=2901228 RepID=UPI001E3917D9|nr:ABC transporter ATP-binding protein [Pseudoclavibacter sp. 13-3]MCD7101633.1 ABC transporter ATP-binding protein/permease [Pseudoclavibacter sp. 13-3]